MRNLANISTIPRARSTAPTWPAWTRRAMLRALGLCGNLRRRALSSMLVVHPRYKRIGRATMQGVSETRYESALLVVGILAVILGASTIIALTIRAGTAVVTVSEATKKILLNYLQVVSLAALFPMQWPPQVENFFAVQSAISSASKALLSPDCELSWMVPAEAFYQKQIGFSLLPVIIVVACTAVWQAAQCLRCSCGAGPRFFARVKQAPPGFYHNRAILSWVVLLYLSYPTMVKQGFAMLACERVGDNFWLAADLQSLAKGRHLAYMLTVCLPQILVYVLGLPLAATLLLHRNKRLMHERTQFRWGLLYAGYRPMCFGGVDHYPAKNRPRAGRWGVWRPTRSGHAGVHGAGDGGHLHRAASGHAPV